MSVQESVILDLSLKEYFLSLLAQVSSESKVGVSDMSFGYLAELLESNVISKTADGETIDSSILNDKMISEQYLIALQESEDGLKSYRLRSVGERALYQVGFFSDSLKRKLTGIDLYFQIGSAAYQNLYVKTQSPIFEDISLKFTDYVDLFMGVSQKVNLQNPSDLLSLFDHLNTRDSKKAEQDLLKQGIIPVKIKKASNQ